MSLFPSVGSTVTKVLTNKNGTAAKVEFDDGCVLYVKYEAFVLDQGSHKSVSESIKVPTNDLVYRENLRPRRNPAKVERRSVQPKVMSESAYKELAEKALSRQSNRQDQIFKQWENETGQHDKDQL